MTGSGGVATAGAHLGQGASAATHGLGSTSRLAIVLIGVITASVSIIGADCLWAVALGQRIANTGRIDGGVYFAAAPTDGWHNVPVLGELILAVVHVAGLPGLVLLNSVCVAAALAFVAIDGRRAGASDRSQAFTLIVATLGVLPDIMVVRLGLFSLPAFALLLLLLRAEYRTPSWRIWLVPVLLTVWGNLHGAVLVGVALSGCYLLFSHLRRSPIQSVLVGLACVVALFVNPQGIGTPSYYRGVMENVARSRGIGMWTPLNFSTPFHFLLLGAAIILMVAAARAQRPTWEWVAAIVLAVAVVSASRYGVWLLLLLTAPAAVGASSKTKRTVRTIPTSTVRAKQLIDIGVLCAAIIVSVVTSVGRADRLSPVPAPVVSAVMRQAAGGPVLAADRAAEVLAMAGTKVVVSDPIDAFSRDDQSAYVEFMQGHESPLSQQVDTILVGPDARNRHHIPGGFHVAQTVSGWRILVRTD